MSAAPTGGPGPAVVLVVWGHSRGLNYVLRLPDAGLLHMLSRLREAAFELQSWSHGAP